MTVTTLVYLIRDDQILLAQKKRGFGAGWWNGVGGKIEPNETIEQALIRECQEEISVTPLTFHKVAEHDFVQQEQGTEPWHMKVHTYFCTEWSGEPEESEEMAPKWLNLNDIPYEEMWGSDKDWLPLALEGKFVRGNFTFNSSNQPIEHSVTVVDHL